MSKLLSDPLALPAGRIIEYISRILSFPSWPSGQSCLNPLKIKTLSVGSWSRLVLLILSHLYHSLISCSSYRVFFFRNSISSWVRVWVVLLDFFLYFPPFPLFDPPSLGIALCRRTQPLLILCNSSPVLVAAAAHSTMAGGIT